ncbi:glycosyl hydrolase [Microdochium bolleyi]|uniref:Glycosyl hydrolase n=1 Tax=Microdochium bolleyi TaxID=196109 RepID=A0A136IU01_9PEZI|nr:glycosyl hydrolase [Microdochium bolleyi]
MKPSVLLTATFGVLATAVGIVQRQASSYEGYAFLYFEPSIEQLFLASSNGNDALSFKPLNSGRPILNSTLGDKGVRDPFILRSVEGDKFYIIATDLCTACGTDWGTAVRKGSRSVMVWESSDLVTFSAQRSVLVSPESYGNTWAPEAYWDDSLGAYVMYWASAIYDQATDPDHTAGQYQRVVYATTQDFITFTAPQVWQDEAPNGRIDSTVIKEGDVYYRFTKATINGCADIVQERSTVLTAPLGDWTRIASCIGRGAGTAEVEGPCIFKTNPGDIRGERFILLADEFGGKGYVPLETTNIAGGEWTLQTNYNFPITPRHGTVIPITAAELAAIDAAWA